MRRIVLTALIAAAMALPAVAAEQKLKTDQAPAPVPAQGAPAPQPAQGDKGTDKGRLPEMDKLMAYVGTPDYFKSMATVALGGEHDITPECKEPKALGRAGLTVLKLPAFKDGTAAPISGLWKDQILVDRCGPKVVHNVLVEGTPDGVHVSLLMPGQTGAPWDWQVDILKEVAAQAMKATGCADGNKVIIFDTRPDKLIEQMGFDEHGRLTSGKWREIWVMRTCGQLQPVGVTVTADGKGRATWDVQAEKKK